MIDRILIPPRYTLFEMGKFFVVHVHQPSFGFFVEAAEFEDEFFLGGENVTKNRKRLRS
jgi:hypothetical protein